MPRMSGAQPNGDPRLLPRFSPMLPAKRCQGRGIGQQADQLDASDREETRLPMQHFDGRRPQASAPNSGCSPGRPRRTARLSPPGKRDVSVMVAAAPNPYSLISFNGCILCIFARSLKFILYLLIYKILRF